MKIDWETLQLRLKLDKEQALLIKYILNHLKDHFIEILSEITADYELSPVEYLADLKMKKECPDDKSLEEKMVDYLWKERRSDTSRSYMMAIGKFNSTTKEEINKLLNKDQKKTLQELEIDNLLDVNTDYSPLDRKIREVIEDYRIKNGIDIFCSIPFEFAYISDTGEVYPCCPSKFKTSIGNLGRDSLHGLWNSKGAQAVRQSILDKTFRFCNYHACEYLRAAKHGSVTDKDDGNDTQCAATDYSSNSPKIINLAYDRSCNLACSTCRDSNYVATGNSFDKVKSINSNLFAKKLEGLERLIISGNGDPFASRTFINLLKNLDRELYPDLKIKIQTNGLLLTPEMWRSIEKSHYAIDWITISIDAASEETYKINRGGDFKKLLKNLEFVGSLKKNGEIKIFYINFVVQANNYMEMKDFVKLGRELGCNCIEFQCVENWGAYTPDEFKRVAIQDKAHPDYNKLIQILKDPIFAEPGINISKFVEILPDNLKELMKRKYKHLQYEWGD